MSELPNWVITIIEVVALLAVGVVGYLISRTLKQVDETLKELREEMKKEKERVSDIDKTVSIHEHRINTLSDTNDSLKIANEMVSKLRVMYTER